MQEGKVILYSGWLSPALCAKNKNMRFVFGDNMKRFGMGGQAIIRRCSNAVGVVTKRKPSMAPGSFFSDDNPDDLDAVLLDLEQLWRVLDRGSPLVIPVTPAGRISLGLERAELKTRAPHIYETIEMHVKEMVDVYGDKEVRAAI